MRKKRPEALTVTTILEYDNGNTKLLRLAHEQRAKRRAIP